jgi:type I restriction enzyme R subunit
VEQSVPPSRPQSKPSSSEKSSLAFAFNKLETDRSLVLRLLFRPVGQESSWLAHWRRKSENVKLAQVSHECRSGSPDAGLHGRRQKTSFVDRRQHSGREEAGAIRGRGSGDGTLLEYFKKATAITAEPPQHEVKSIIEIIDDIWNNRDRDYNIRRLVKRLQRIDKEMSGKGREMFAAYISQGDMAAYARELPRNLQREFTATMSLLRDSQFQDLLLNYPRRERTFLIAYEAEDTVTSSWLVRGTDGKEYKPEDYLTVFAKFVRENPAHVEAIRILLNRPKDWSTGALTELRQKLAAAPQRFTIENLSKTHEIHYHKALVDIVSMVKHAANQEEPLYSPEERVKLAVARISVGKAFTVEQIQWLDRIEAHLVENLTIDPDDFDNVPVLSRAGGWGRANRVFEGKLPQMIGQLNEAIAS